MRDILITMSITAFFGFAQARDFSEGQVWSYKARRGEEGSSLIINKVETHPKLGSIYHISIAGLKIRNPNAPSGFTAEFSHAPVSKETLEQSCEKLLRRSRPESQYLEGYAEWKSAFDQGNAGVFTISVADIVNGIEKAINQ